MARPLRIEFSGAVYHVTSRGNGRQHIFADDFDRQEFLNILATTAGRYNWLCHAYCLMGNHYHLLLETPDPDLAMGMRMLNGVYTQFFNRRHDRVGHLFQGRYKSILVEKETHLLELSRYIVLNPVAAGMVSRPEQWPWSSFLATVGEAERPDFLVTDWLLGQFAGSRERAGKVYRDFVEEGRATPRNPWEALKGQVILGSDKFVAQMAERLAGKQHLTEVPRRQRYSARPPLPELLTGCANKIERNARIIAAHVEHGYQLKEIAACLGLHYTTVSKVIAKDGKNLFFKT